MVAAEPHKKYRGRDWTFWQWTQTGTMAGVRGEVDRNVFYGDVEQWTLFLLTGCDPRALAGASGAVFQSARAITPPAIREEKIR